MSNLTQDLWFIPTGRVAQWSLWQFGLNLNVQIIDVKFHCSLDFALRCHNRTGPHKALISHLCFLLLFRELFRAPAFSSGLQYLGIDGTFNLIYRLLILADANLLYLSPCFIIFEYKVKEIIGFDDIADTSTAGTFERSRVVPSVDYVYKAKSFAFVDNW